MTRERAADEAQSVTAMLYALSDIAGTDYGDRACCGARQGERCAPACRDLADQRALDAYLDRWFDAEALLSRPDDRAEDDD